MNQILATLLGSKGYQTVQAVQGFLSGKKTYILAISAAVTALANLLNQFSSLPGSVSFFEWARHLTGNSDALVLWHSLCIMTGRAAISKAAGPDPVVNAKTGP